MKPEEKPEIPQPRCYLANFKNIEKRELPRSCLLGGVQKSARDEVLF